ncbi:MAG: SpoVK/Ycf46/Vps4 family AAA+-type ATPase, partial [Parvicella sp.]
RLVAVVPFGMGNSFEEGIPQILTGALTPIVKEAEIQEEKLEELILDLNKLTGLESIKKQVTEYIQYLRFEEIRKQKGLSHNKNINLHTVFTGNPGTGKTTVAKKMGKIFKAMGLLTGGHVHEVDRSDLVGEFIGQTAPKVKEAIKKAKGGVLFIDEAYSLSREGESSKDYGKEVIEILLKEMSDGDGNIAIFVAGYPREMDIFVKSNPGLKSRFGNYYNFPDYLPEDLMTIAKLNLGDRKLFIDDDALEYFKKKVIRSYRERDDSFGNARYVLSLVDGAKMNMALRLVKKQDPSTLNDKELSTINIEDVQGVFASTQARKLNLPINEERLRDAMDELATLIGMENIKQEIRDMIKLVRYYNEIGKDVLNKFVMHTVFKGNPGTGKTTVARIFAKIFYALGILEKGHLVECDRASLIGEYSGQTAPKTLAKIEEAIGGVLFIDEAYSLVEGGGSLGKEAISTILKQMEDRNTEFILIAAGYPKNMDEFLLSNPGLKSRFDQSLTFEDYQVEELSQIADLMFNNEELSLADDAKVILDKHLSDMYQHRDEFFGNAREVRKLVQQISQFHHLRLADMESSQRTVKMITTVTVEDLTNLKPFEGSGRIKIGF